MNEQEVKHAQQLLDAAIGYAQRGVPVFPCHYITKAGSCSCGKDPCDRAGKHPMTPNGFKDATTDIARIRQYWQCAQLANIGIQTGAESGFIVVDVDPRHGGDESLTRYESTHGSMGATPRVNTGGGGHHILFKHPGWKVKNSGRGLPGLPGMDIRGDGGYIIAAPSNHVSGQSYEWQPGLGLDDVALAPVPDALAKILTDNTDKSQRINHQSADGASGNQSSADEDIPEGSRNDTLFRRACKLRRAGLDILSCKAALREENLLKCSPALSESELDRISESAYRYSDDPDHVEWDQPIPLPRLEMEVPSFPPEIIPEAFRPWVHDIAERLQVPIEMIAAPALVTLGSLIGRRCAIYPKREDTDWLEHPNLWGVVVAPPGWMKSPALKEVLKPIERLEVAAAEQFEQKQRQWQTQKQVLELKIKVAQKALTDAISGRGSVERAERNLAQLNAQLQDGTPKLRRYIANDATVEKLGEILKDNPNGILIFRDELYGLLKGMEKQGHETERTFYLESWNGNGRFTSDRIERGTVIIPAICLSVLGGIQPDPLNNYFSNVVKGDSGDDGLLSRFQLIMYPGTISEWKNVDRKPDAKARERAFKIYEVAAQLESCPIPFMRSSAAGAALVHFNEEAQEYFYRWLQNLMARLRSGKIGSSAFESHVTKYRKLMPALALLFHLIDVLDKFNHGQGHVSPSEVSLDAVKMAVKWCEILEVHARKVYAGTFNVGLQAAHALAKKIQTGRVVDGVPVREICRHQWSFLNKYELVEQGIALLERHGWLKVMTRHAGQNGGASSDYIRLNPALLATERRGGDNG